MVGNALITHTQTVCPDTVCQKIVDEEIIARREKKEKIINQRKIRAQQFRIKQTTTKPVV